MGMWRQLFGEASDKPLNRGMYRVALTLYSRDRKRSAEIREFDNGETCLLEGEWLNGIEFRERHDGRMLEPFRSA